MSLESKPQVPTVYGKPGCVQCKFTCRELDRLQVTYNYVDISVNPVAAEQVKGLGYSSVPVVVTAETHWAGFKVDRIRKMV